jgi:AraC-like DNA-binding protein
MNYEEYHPALALSSFAHRLWIQEKSAALHNRDCTLPNSYIELVINCGAPLYWLTERGNAIDLPDGYLMGLHRKPLHVKAKGNTFLIGVRLYPWAAGTLLNMHSALSEQPFLALDSAWHPFVKHLKKMVWRHPKEAIDDLQQFLTNLPLRSHPDMEAIQQGGQQIYAANGDVRVTSLAEKTYRSVCQFERQFKKYLGLTPKAFARLIRFETARNCLTKATDLQFSGIASQLGYFDQSHFINDFKLFANYTPREFLMHKLSLNRFEEDADFFQYPFP